MTKLILLILSLSLRTFATPDWQAEQTCGETIGSCEFYTCISEFRDCKANQYPLAFGKMYCEKFWQDQINYSIFGQAVLHELRTCLQVKLLESQHNASCSQMRGLAYSQHIECYLSSGFCELPAKDKARLIRTVSGELKDKAFLATAWRIEKSCLQINRN